MIVTYNKEKQKVLITEKFTLTKIKSLIYNQLKYFLEYIYFENVVDSLLSGGKSQKLKTKRLVVLLKFCKIMLRYQILSKFKKKLWNLFSF